MTKQKKERKTQFRVHNYNTENSLIIKLVEHNHLMIKQRFSVTSFSIQHTKTSMNLIRSKAPSVLSFTLFCTFGPTYLTL